MQKNPLSWIDSHGASGSWSINGQRNEAGYGMDGIVLRFEEQAKRAYDIPSAARDALNEYVVLLGSLRPDQSFVAWLSEDTVEWQPLNQRYRVKIGVYKICDICRRTVHLTTRNAFGWHTDLAGSECSNINKYPLDLRGPYRRPQEFCEGCQRKVWLTENSKFVVHHHATGERCQSSGLYPLSLMGKTSRTVSGGAFESSRRKH